MDKKIYESAEFINKDLDEDNLSADEKQQLAVQIKTLTDDNSIVIAQTNPVTGDIEYNAKKAQFGFNEKEPDIQKVSNADFIKYGMTDEFMGRHYIQVHLNDLNAETMLKILNESKKSPLKLQKKLFKKMGVDIRFTSEYKKLVVEEALRRKTGARSLAGIVAESTWLPIQEIDRNRGKYNKLIIGKDTMQDPKKYILRRD